MSDPEGSLPPGWTSAQLSDICLPVETTDPRTRPNDWIEYIDISSIDRESKRIVETKHLSGKDAPSRARQEVQGGDVLFSTVRPNLQAIATVPDRLHGQVASTGFCVLRPASGVSSDFLFRAVLEDSFQARVQGKARGVSYPAVRDRDVLEEWIAVAPQPEQERIAGEVEGCLSRIDMGKSAVRQARVKLPAWEAALLRSAVSGELTAAGAIRCPDPDHPELDALPGGWRWQRLEELAAGEPRALTDGPFGSNLKTEHYTPEGPRVIRLQNIGEGAFIDVPAHISEDRFELLRGHEARAGDVVIASLGEDAPRACVVPEWLGPAIVKADCPRLRVRADVSAEYVAAALNSPPVRAQAATIIHGVGRPRLNLRSIRSLLIPLPPRIEQDRIMSFLREGFSSSEALNDQLETELRRSDSLAHAVLRDAFAGRLVPQDPSDEPVSELLARIQGQRAAREAERRTKRPSRRGRKQKTHGLVRMEG